MNKTKLRWFILLPGLAMSMGWGLRGQIGHWSGAMIPGMFLALALSILLQGKQISRGLVIALAGVSLGFGADMTTLQSAGLAIGNFSHVPNATILGYGGIVIKGALWPLFTGAFLGLAFAASHYRLKDIILALVLMVMAFYAGWALIDRSKLIYFSVDRPESWGGLVFAAIALLVTLTVRGRTRIPFTLALCGALAGGTGYPIGVTLTRIGRHSSYVGHWFIWWKVAETTFGAFMGVGLGLGTYFLKDHLPDAGEYKEQVVESGFRWWEIALGMALGFVWVALYHDIPWMIVGPILICLAFYSFKAAWHIGITLTFSGGAGRRRRCLAKRSSLWCGPCCSFRI